VFELITFDPKIMGSYGTLHASPPIVTTLSVYTDTASLGYEVQIAAVTAIVLMIPGAGWLLPLERFLKSEYLVVFGQP